MSDVFISYSRVDSGFIHTLFDALKARGLDPWVDWEDIPKGTDWWDEIAAGIEGSDSAIFVVSPDSLKSEVCHREIAHARGFHKRLLPVIYRDVDEKVLAGEWFEKEWESTARTNWQTLRHINWLFFRATDDFPTAFAELYKILTTDVDHVKYHTRLTVRAKEWEDQDSKPEFLLRGDDLRTAEKWLADSQSRDPRPTNLHARYIQASAAEELRLQKAEQERQALELALQRRAANRLRYLAVGLAVFLTITAGLGLYANQRRLEAARQRDRALRGESETLVQLARQQDTTDPLASVYLSARALPGTLGGNRSILPEAKLTLAQALQITLEQAYITQGIQSSAQVAFAPDHIALGGSGVMVVDPDLTHPLTVIALNSDEQAAPTSSGYAVQWSSDGRLLAANSSTVQVWQADRLVANHTFDEPIISATWQPGGTQVAISGVTSVWLWTLDQPPTVLHTFSGDLQPVRWSPDGSQLAAWDQNPADGTTTLLIWGPLDAAPLVTQVFETYLLSLAWSLDSSAILLPTTDPDHVAWLLPISPAGGLVSLEGHTDQVAGGLFLSAGTVLTWSYDGSARLWDADGTPIRAFIDPDRSGGRVRGAVLSGDEESLIVFYDNGLAHLWNVDSGESIVSLRGHSGAVLSATWRGAYVMTTGVDATARLWDATTGQELLTLAGHTDRVLDVYFTDDQHVLTASQDGSGGAHSSAAERRRHSSKKRWSGVAMNGRALRRDAGKQIPTRRTEPHVA